MRDEVTEASALVQAEPAREFTVFLVDASEAMNEPAGLRDVEVGCSSRILHIKNLVRKIERMSSSCLLVLCH